MFPNKVVSLHESILPVMVEVLGLIKQGKKKPYDIFRSLNRKYDIDMIIISLDILFSIKQVEIDSKGCLYVI